MRLLAHEGVSGRSTGHIRLFVSGSAPLLRETNKITSGPYEGARCPCRSGFRCRSKIRKAALREAFKTLFEPEA